MARTHLITVAATPHTGSIPYAFRAQCTCRWANGYNAWKWVALGIQTHLTDVGLMNDRGRLPADEGDATP